MFYYSYIDKISRWIMIIYITKNYDIWFYFLFYNILTDLWIYFFYKNIQL